MRSRGSQDGQSTIEYAGVLLLVCALLAGLALVPFDGRPIAGAVSHQLAYALCVVTRGDCDEDRRPCATSSDQTRMGASLDFLFVHLGRHHVLVREERSDGTVALSLVREDEGGVQAGTGVKASLRLGAKAFALGGELSAALLAQTGSGSTWVLSRARADELQRRLEERLAAAPATALLPSKLVDELLPGVPPPAQTFAEQGLSASAGFSGGKGSSVGATPSAAETFGSRVDHASGRRTFYVKQRGELKGALHVSALGDASGTAADEVQYAITFGRDGVPLDLEVIESGTLSGSANLTRRLEQALRGLRTAASGDRMWVGESHLDLTDPSNLDVAQRFIAEVRAPKLRLGPAVAVSRELSQALARRAVVNLLTYDVRSSAYEGSVTGKVEGVGVGVDAGVSHEQSRLIAASTRGLDGQWRERGDCIAAAATGRPQAPSI